MSNISKFQLDEMLRRKPLLQPPPPALQSVPLEKQLHAEIKAYCDSQWPRWKYVHSRMDKPTLGEKGVPDFVIAMPGAKTLYVEAKRLKEKVKPAQAMWHAEMRQLGHTVHVVYTLQEFLAVVKQTTS